MLTDAQRDELRYLINTVAHHLNVAYPDARVVEDILTAAGGEPPALTWRTVWRAAARALMPWRVVHLTIEEFANRVC